MAWKRNRAEDVIMEALRINPAKASEAARAVRAAEPAIVATDFQIGVLWERMSRPYVMGWIEPDATGVRMFLKQFGAKLVEDKAAA